MTSPERNDAAAGRPRPTDRPEGPRCRECGCRHFATLETRKSEKGIWRRRECRNCGKIVSSREIFCDDEVEGNGEQ